MKYYLLKQLNYYKSRKENINEYIPIDINDRKTIISRELIIVDEVKDKLWYCFVYTPEPKLNYVSKSNRTNIEDNLKSELNNPDSTAEGLHEVSKEIFDKFLNFELGKKGKNKDIQKIIKKVEKLNG